MGRAGALSSLGPFSYPYSPECVEEKFCELRLLGILGSSTDERRSYRAILVLL
jgi:hypothetical protein